MVAGKSVVVLTHDFTSLSWLRAVCIGLCTCQRFFVLRNERWSLPSQACTLVTCTQCGQRQLLIAIPSPVFAILFLRYSTRARHPFLHLRCNSAFLQLNTQYNGMHILPLPPRCASSASSTLAQRSGPHLQLGVNLKLVRHRVRIRDRWHWQDSILDVMACQWLLLDGVPTPQFNPKLDFAYPLQSDDLVAGGRPGCEIRLGVGGEGVALREVASAGGHNAKVSVRIRVRVESMSISSAGDREEACSSGLVWWSSRDNAGKIAAGSSEACAAPSM